MEPGAAAAAYISTVWGQSRRDAFLEISARTNGVAGSRAAAAKKSGWKTQHVRLGDLLDGGVEAVQGLLEIARSPSRVDLYLGCMPLSEAPEKGRGKGDLRESVPGIWFDIDAQAPGREVSARGVPLFATPEAALAALDEFCAERGVRAGVVTDSGWGVHAWILFDDAPAGLGSSNCISEPANELTNKNHKFSEEDKTAGQSPASYEQADLIELVRIWNVDFASWCLARHGVHVDVVSDKTRVLRIPETVNWRKADNLDEAEVVRLVRCSPERYSIAQLGWTPELLEQLEAEKRERIERMARGRWSGGGEGGEGDGALLDGVAALDACSWAEILTGFGWRQMEVEGSGEIERWGRPRGAGLVGSGARVEESGVSSAVVFADAPWVLVVFSEAADLPAWEKVRAGIEKPNTKWRTWVRLEYGGDEMRASSDAVRVALYGYPRHWPKTAADVLRADGEIFRSWTGVGSGSGTKVGVGAA